MARYAPTNHQIAKAEGMVWLQGCGYAPAKPASELKTGDVILFNFYGNAMVASAALNAKGTSVTLIVESNSKTYTMRKRATTLVGIKPTPDA